MVLLKQASQEMDLTDESLFDWRGGGPEVSSHTATRPIQLRREPS